MMTVSGSSNSVCEYYLFLMGRVMEMGHVMKMEKLLCLQCWCRLPYNQMETKLVTIG